MTRDRVLVTVSGTLDPEIVEKVAAGTVPRRDYLELAKVMDADIVDVTEARRRAGPIGRLLERVGGTGALVGWVCFRQRRRYAAVFTDSELVGLPLMLLCRLTFRPHFPHVMIAHILSVPKKSLLWRVLRLGHYVDSVIVYSTSQRQYAIRALGCRPERVVLSTFMVDTEFFAPGRVAPTTTAPTISSAGLEFRDYPTLIEAVHDVDVKVVIAAASPWSKRPDSTEQATPPANVTVTRLDFVALRQLYADSRLIVMPLYDTPFQAGVTTILEAMAMGKAVLCSRSEGQTDVIVDGVTGVYTPVGDARRMRDNLLSLLTDPSRTARLGAAARQWVTQECDVTAYAKRLAAVVEHAIARAR